MFGLGGGVWVGAAAPPPPPMNKGISDFASYPREKVDNKDGMVILKMVLE